MVHIYEFKPDLVLLDWNIPIMSGQEVLVKLRSDPDLHSVHVAVMVSSKTDIDFLEQFEPTPNAYVEKPLDLEKLASIISCIDHFAISIVLAPAMEAKK